MIVNLYLAKLIIRLGRFIQSQAILALRPDDLIRFGKKSYERPDNKAFWSQDAFIDEGLSSEESDLLERLPLQSGELLLLGMGTGREAIPLARHGFRVTGVDFVSDYLQLAESKARSVGLELTGWQRDISRMDYPPERFCAVWISAAMYSFIPTRKRREQMLKRLRAALVDQGALVCQFHLDPHAHKSKSMTRLRKIISLFLLGSGSYESGDMLWRNAEFLHAFRDEQDLSEELESAGFRKNFFIMYSGGPRGGSIWTKA
jgi:SAM-dependent methyltransferase